MPKVGSGGRPTVVAVRLSVAETDRLDLDRGRLSRSVYLRMLLNKGVKT
jgi:hypothetical protein